MATLLVLFRIELDAVYSVSVVVGSGLAKDERGSFLWREMEALGDTAKEHMPRPSKVRRR